jgi:uncharacterized membrane protein
MHKKPKNIGNNQIAKHQNNHIAQVQSVSFQGPLPPPQILKQYDDIVPGCAERIISQFESQVKHRQELEKKVITSDIRQTYFGSTLGFIIALSAIGAGTFLAYIGRPTEGISAIIAALAGIVGVYGVGSYQRKKERDLKSDNHNQSK